LDAQAVAQTPAKQAMPEPQEVPSGLVEVLQPTPAAQAAVWQASGGLQVSGLPVQLPLEQKSPFVQLSPSLQAPGAG
jgi:hypothetical protein